jgi:hypothetical protein
MSIAIGSINRQAEADGSAGRNTIFLDADMRKAAAYYMGSVLVKTSIPSYEESLALNDLWEKDSRKYRKYMLWDLNFTVDFLRERSIIRV